MKKAAILYHSKTGTTANYAAEISRQLKNKGFEVCLSSIQEFDKKCLTNADYIFLGCWTSGLLFFGQHPEKAWVEFVGKLPEMSKSKLVLFTTYKVRTGSMFRKMFNLLEGKFNAPSVELKSRNGKLTFNNLIDLEAFVG